MVQSPSGLQSKKRPLVRGRNFTREPLIEQRNGRRASYDWLHTSNSSALYVLPRVSSRTLSPQRVWYDELRLGKLVEIYNYTCCRSNSQPDSEENHNTSWRSERHSEMRKIDEKRIGTVQRPMFEGARANISAAVRRIQSM